VAECTVAATDDLGAALGRFPTVVASDVGFLFLPDLRYISVQK
jgi:hypothetical protein